MSSPPVDSRKPREVCLDALRRLSDDPRRFVAITLGSLALFLLATIAETSVDLDLWHEMAWARESWSQGQFLQEDCFSYSPTASPVVHHEWGTGAILYATYSALALPGLLLLRYALIAVVVLIVWKTALHRGASRSVLALCAVLAIPMITPWMGTVRAQLFTMVGLSALLWILSRPWSARSLLWLGLVFLLWLNLHAGFVTGLALLLVHTIEEGLRRRPVGRWLLAIALVVALISVNPWNLDYYRYLARAIPMSRELITEWYPIHRAGPVLITFYGITVALTLYVLLSLGPRHVPGILLILAAAIAGARHCRHASLLGLVWLAVLPGALTRTPLGRALSRLRARQAPLITAGGLALLLSCLVITIQGQPWRLRLPTTLESSARPYPVAAIEHLRTSDFRGNLMTPFEVGAFVSWSLHPKVKVSFDGRYEVAYDPGLLERQLHFYAGEDGWLDFLLETRSDAVLVPRYASVLALLEAAPGWSLRHQDSVYAVFEHQPSIADRTTGER